MISRKKGVAGSAGSVGKIDTRISGIGKGKKTAAIGAFGGGKIRIGNGNGRTDCVGRNSCLAPGKYLYAVASAFRPGMRLFPLRIPARKTVAPEVMIIDRVPLVAGCRLHFERIGYAGGSRGRPRNGRRGKDVVRSRHHDRDGV